MKTKVLLAVTLLAGLATSAQAGLITGTKHDLSSSNASATSIKSSSQNQTCVFCHAPHNAVTAKLLWNRSFVSGSTMKVYTSYNTKAMRDLMTDTGANVTLKNDSTSLLCLSCHSLTTSAAIMAATTGAPTDSGQTGTGLATTGGMSDLTKDHPVGIPYNLAVGTGIKAVADVTNTTFTATEGGLRLFKSSISDTTMECASCHSVHSNDNGKFLAKANNNSNLCKTCHIK